jgi:hypothetical protein
MEFVFHKEYTDFYVQFLQISGLKFLIAWRIGTQANVFIDGWQKGTRMLKK